MVIVYADSPDLLMAQKVISHQWSEFTRTVREDQVPLHVRSYQEILTLAQETTRQGRGEHMVWKDLDEWIHKKYRHSMQAGEHQKEKATISNGVPADRNG